MLVCRIGPLRWNSENRLFSRKFQRGRSVRNSENCCFWVSLRGTTAYSVKFVLRPKRVASEIVLQVTFFVAVDNRMFGVSWWPLRLIVLRVTYLSCRTIVPHVGSRAWIICLYIIETYYLGFANEIRFAFDFVPKECHFVLGPFPTLFVKASLCGPKASGAE